VSFERALLVTVSESEDGQHDILCAHDLGRSAEGPGTSVCGKSFAAPSPFFRMLVSDDGMRIAYAERVWGRTRPDPRDEYQRDASADSCFFHVLDRRTGRDVRWKSVCTITTEAPLRFDADVLVTDAAKITGCTASVVRRYDVSSGAPRGESVGAAPREDVDDKLVAAVRKDTSGVLPFVVKRRLWASTYGVDEVVAWSEGPSVLARKGADLLLCQKRAGTCASTLASVDEGAVGGASSDGVVLGAFSRGRFFAVNSSTGAKVDVAIEGAGPSGRGSAPSLDGGRRLVK
jgi:hypothetical protein